MIPFLSTLNTMTLSRGLAFSCPGGGGCGTAAIEPGWNGRTDCHENHQQDQQNVDKRCHVDVGPGQYSPAVFLHGVSFGHVVAAFSPRALLRDAGDMRIVPSLIAVQVRSQLRVFCIQMRG